MVVTRSDKAKMMKRKNQMRLYWRRSVELVSVEGSAPKHMYHHQRCEIIDIFPSLFKRDVKAQDILSGNFYRKGERLFPYRVPHPWYPLFKAFVINMKAMCEYIQREYNNNSKVLVKIDKAYIHESALVVELICVKKFRGYFDTLVEELRVESRSSCGLCGKVFYNNYVEYARLEPSNETVEVAICNECEELPLKTLPY